MCEWVEWSFKVYSCGNRRTAMNEWTIPEEAQAAIDVRINFLRITRTWERPHFDKLHGYQHIHEIRIKHKRVEYRPLGYYGPSNARWCFTILKCAKEKDDKFVPKNAPATAEERRGLVESDPGGHTVDYEE